MTLPDRSLDKTIYLDNAATSYPKPEAVYAAMDSFARHVGGSGGRSSHRRALESSTVVDGTREALAELFGVAQPECVCFGANATDGLNLAIYGLAEPGCRIVTSQTEHNSVRRPLADLRTRLGCEVVQIPADSNGKWDPRQFLAVLTRETAFVAVGWASNVTGTLQELEPVARACERLGVPLVVDAAQVAGAVPFDFKSLGLAALAFTGHKSLLGPQGTGGLIVAPELAPRLRPFRRGGSGTVSHSEVHPDFLPDRFEAGTLNCHGLAGLQAGARYLLARGIASVRSHEMALWQRFRDGLRELPHVRVHGPTEASHAVAILSVTVQGMEPTDVGFLLDMRHGILTRTGLHCAPGSHQAIGTMPTGTTRFSLGFATTEADVDAALHALAHIRERDWRAAAAESTSSSRLQNSPSAHPEPLEGGAVAGTPLPPPGTIAGGPPPNPPPPGEEGGGGSSGLPCCSYKKSYRIDRLGFLADSSEWDEAFATAMAPTLGIPGGLTDEHWKVLRFLRTATAELGRCPLVYQTCKRTGLGLEKLQGLFPTGYLRGACKLAGVTYDVGSSSEPRAHPGEGAPASIKHGKTYPVNAQGFLLDPDHWDETFAECKAEELGLAGTLTEAHWRIVHWLRDSFRQTNQVPTVFETCRQCSVSLDELEKLFPTGYHRGAVKVAGLRVL